MEIIFQIYRWHGHFICDQIIRSLDFATVAYLRWMAKVKKVGTLAKVTILRFYIFSQMMLIFAKPKEFLKIHILRKKNNTRTLHNNKMLDGKGRYYGISRGVITEIFR